MRVYERPSLLLNFNRSAVVGLFSVIASVGIAYGIEIEEESSEDGQYFLQLSEKLSSQPADTKDSFRWSLGARIEQDWLLEAEESSVKSNAELRRARLSLSARKKALRVALSVELKNSEVRPQDARIDYRPHSDWQFSAGYMQEPFSLSRIESSSGGALLERPAVIDVTPGYHSGIKATYAPGPFAVTAGYFLPVGHDRNFGPNEEAVTTRMTASKSIARNTRLHAGASASWRYPENTSQPRLNGSFSSRQLRGTNVRSNRVDDAKQEQQLGIEVAMQTGRWLVQAEWLQATIDSATKNEAISEGGYIQVAYSQLPPRKYNVRGGKFSNHHDVKGWEFALRAEQLEIVENGAPQSGHELTAGVNYYATGWLRLSANVSEYQIDGNATEQAAFSRVQVRF